MIPDCFEWSTRMNEHFESIDEMKKALIRTFFGDNSKLTA
jgi:hypothetical protein